MAKRHPPQPLPETREELHQVEWDLVFGDSLCKGTQEGALRYIYTECETFSEAIKPRHRIIMGRQGSGKSSLVKRIMLGTEYDFKIRCKKNDLIRWIGNSIPESLSSEIPVDSYVDECNSFYWLLIFEKIQEHNSDQKEIGRFLSSVDSTDESILERWSSTNMASRNISISIAAGVISGFVRSNKSSFDKAKVEAISFLKGKKLVILIDSLEDYTFRTEHQQKVFAALLLSAVGFGGNNSVVIKCFLPSESYTQLERYAVNWGKINQRITFLRWKPEELLVMLCKRLAFGLYRNGKSDYLDLSELDSIDSALSFWKQYFPPRITNEAFDGIEEPTVHYILRHTQLTPRQSIQLCNSIVDEASETFPSEIIPVSKIRDGIEKCERQLCKEVFSTFKYIYPSAEDFCSENLQDLAASFRITSIKSDVYYDIADIERYLPYKKDYELLKRMLFELGIVGVKNTVDSSLSSTYNFAQFEPNQDTRLNPNKNDDLLVHPMFIHKINFTRDKSVCSKPICSVQMSGLTVE